jgi:hypothetical protein
MKDQTFHGVWNFVWNVAYLRQRIVIMGLRNVNWLSLMSIGELAEVFEQKSSRVTRTSNNQTEAPSLLDSTDAYS